jgi:hypothetical protein
LVTLARERSRERRLNALFAAVLRQADAREAVGDVTIAIGQAQTVIAACSDGFITGDFANRCRSHVALGVDASIALELADAFHGQQVTVDIFAT